MAGSAKGLGGSHVGEFEERAESGGSHVSRAAAAADYSRTIEEFEKKTRGAGEIRKAFRDRPDYRSFDRYVRNEPKAVGTSGVALAAKAAQAVRLGSKLYAGAQNALSGNGKQP